MKKYYPSLERILPLIFVYNDYGVSLLPDSAPLVTCGALGIMIFVRVAPEDTVGLVGLRPRTKYLTT